MTGLPHIAQPIVEPPFQRIIDAIEEKGYLVIDGLLPREKVDALLSDYFSIDADEFSRAGVGREVNFLRDKTIRGDEIRWLEGQTTAVRYYLNWMEQLRLQLNQHLFLGLFDYEAHYAHYGPGTFYKKHLDAFKGHSNRRLSTIFYLNPEWKPGDGGELVIYDQQDKQVLKTVTPEYGRMVIFLSEAFPHEVLPTTKPRRSITGWFRINNSLGGMVDPSR